MSGSSAGAGVNGDTTMRPYSLMPDLSPLLITLTLVLSGCGGGGPNDPRDPGDPNNDPARLGEIQPLDVQIVEEIETRSSVLQPGDRFVVEGDPDAQEALVQRLLAILSAPDHWSYANDLQTFTFGPDGYYEYDNYNPVLDTDSSIDTGHSEGWPTLFAIGAYYLADGRGPFLGAEVVMGGDPNDPNEREAIVASESVMVHVTESGIDFLYEAR